MVTRETNRSEENVCKVSTFDSAAARKPWRSCALPYNDLSRILPLTKTKILVVDDEEAIREVVSTLLEAQGHECTSMSNGLLAQKYLQTNTVDLVLSDMVMPEMDGLTLLGWLRKNHPDTPVIMVTAMYDLSTALEAIRHGA